MEEFQEFPKMLYFKGDATNQQVVNSQAEEDALGADWVDAPVDPLAVVVPAAKPAKK